MKKLTVLLTISLLLLSCNSNLRVEKRRYMKGYHVNLGSREKKNISAKELTQPLTEVQEKSISASKEESLIASVEQTSHYIAQPKLPRRITTSASSYNKVAQPEETPARKKRYHKTDSVPSVTNEPDETLAILAFVFVLTGLVVWPLFLIGFIFSIVALSKIRNYPDLYGGKGYATAAFIIGLIPLIAIAVILIAFLASGGFSI